MVKFKSDEILDLKGVPCPRNSARALLKLGGMEKGEILEIIVDDGEPVENVPASIAEEDNYKIIEKHEGEDHTWHLWVKVLR
jgi:TusA-related sulfurtransferase